METKSTVFISVTFCILFAAVCFWGLYYIGKNSHETNELIAEAAQNLYKSKVMQVPMAGSCNFTGPRVLKEDSAYNQVFVYIKDCPERDNRYEEYLLVTCTPSGDWNASYDLKGRVLPVCRASDWVQLK